MNDSIFSISLDMHKHGSQAVLKVKQGDTGRTLRISLRDGGTTYIIAEGCYAAFKATKPDGKVLYNACTIEDNEIVYEFTEQTCATVGRCLCEIALSGMDGKLITSPQFALFVDSTVYPDGTVVSIDEFNTLTNLVANATVAIEGADNAANSARQAAVEAQQAEQRATNAASAAEGATADAMTATVDAMTATGNAITATENANKATQSANTATNNANLAAVSANEAAKSANQVANGVTTKTLTEADFAIGRITSTNLSFNYNSTNAVATPAFLPCTEDEPYSTTVNGSLVGSYSVVYYHNETILGVVSGLRTNIPNLCDFGGFENAGIAAKQVTHIRVMIVYPGSNGPVTPDNFPAVVGQVTFSRTYTDPHIRHSDLDAFGKKLNIRENPAKVIFLGDSITAGSAGPSWTTSFLEKIHGELIANVAVGGANLKDMEGTEYKSDLEYEYDKDNVLSNQVHHILENTTYAAPDIILIAIGTNDGIVITEADMDTAYSVPLDNVDIRRTAAGAFRYASEMLHDKYPNAVIFWCSPIHRKKIERNSAGAVVREVFPSDVRKWNESLRIATEYTGLQHIDTLHCGICSAYERDGAAGQYLKDGLHPNADGAKKIGYYNAGKVNAVIF